jgi:DUF2075 family protein
MGANVNRNLFSSFNYGWKGTIATFLSIPLENWLVTLQQNYAFLYRQQSTATHRQAWLDSGEILRSQFTQLLQLRPTSADWFLIFEYELPQEGGRRPDLVILATGQILVLEFKQKVKPNAADLDQVAAYARDLAEYHRASQGHPIQALLIPTRNPTADTDIVQNVTILPPLAIAQHFNHLPEFSFPIHPESWIQADYAPLPSVIQAARAIFQHEPLPDIKRAQSAGIPDLLAYLNQVLLMAQTDQERHLILITGVPGAGKTLVGLQFVYQNPIQAAGERQAIYLSGNGPLIAVLQYALKSRAFVQAARNFYIQHEVRRQSAPKEHIIVFDEAQRAWDSNRMGQEYGIVGSAPVAILRIAERQPDWSVVVGLIGEGQQIHVGEEEGIEQWNQGLEQARSPWQVHCSPQHAEYFTAVAPDHLHTADLFNLTTSLRTHLAKHVQTWVACVLAAEPHRAAEIMPDLIAEGFVAYLTRDLAAAQQYCRDRYQHQLDKRYGLLASSRARNLVNYGIPNDYKSTQRVKVGPWYIDPPDSSDSCCAFTGVVTEFGCQGLELDFPIIAWGDDLLWQTSQWMTHTRQRQVRDPLRLRLNSYRVLLTRGRDGLIIFVPPEAKLNSTYLLLMATGLISLE